MKNARRINSVVLLVLLCGLAVSSAAQEKGAPRIRYTINDNWKFFPNEIAGAEKPDSTDENWQRVSIPHTWNAEDSFDDEPGYRRGAGWYRRALNLNPNLKNKRIFLYFEAANHTADVYLNGAFLGQHVGGYTAFAFDVTELVEFDKPNLLAVRVDNALDKDKPPIDGDFTMYGGLYRDVWLVATGEVHFKVTDFAAPGVRIETPQVAAAAANVRISGTIVNSGKSARRIEIASTIFDAENRQIGSSKSILTVNAGGEGAFAQTTDEIKNPRLWSPDEPNLYRVRTLIRENGRVLDEITSPLGFRWFRFDGREGFFLNGKHLKLRGTNRHQDYNGLGNAVPDRLQARDLEIIRENGFNFLRLAHYPQDASVLEAADRLGLIVWEEIPIVNQIHVSEKFNANAKRMLTEMIRQHRNHPSIIVWGYMNEVFLPVPKSDEVTNATVALARELEKICKAEDASRATAIAFDWGARELYHTSGLSRVTDIIGWNLYHGWYYETFADFGKFIDDQHRRFPDRPLIISEYGVNGDQRLHSPSPKRFDSTIEWQRMYHEAYLPQIAARRFIAGSAIWNQFDFGSEFRGETIPHLNQKGLFTYDRLPKDISFFYKANFSREWVLHIAARDWKFRSGAALQTIDVYSNLPEIELFQNGAPLGKKRTGGYKTASWNVVLKDGVNAFAARGFKDKNSFFDRAEVYFSDTTKPFDSGFRDIAVNVGSNSDFTGGDGRVWTADQLYKAGGFGFAGSGAKPFSTLRNVLGSADDPLFQTMVEGLTVYKFDVPDGEYEIELRFVEPQFKVGGERVFGVMLNGQTVLENLDLAGTAGWMRAYSPKFRVAARDQQGVSVEFSAIRDKPVLSGVWLQRIF